MSKPITNRWGLRGWLIAMCMCCSAIASAQIQLEYYGDTDPGYGKAIALPVSTDADETGTYTVTFEASTAGLTAGLHKLGMRALSAEYWSPTIFGYVMIARGNVYADRVEYFWDTDPGYGRATQVSIATGDDPTTVSFDIDVDGLSEGVHTLGLRSYALGWSPTVQYLVRIEGGEPVLIDAIEYYWDTDGFPAFGEARQVSFTPGTTVELTDWVIPTEGMTGDRILYIRAHSKGGWSPFVEHTISFSAEGNYTLDERDAYKHFDDSVCAICDFERRDILYEVPYGTMVKDGFDNIIAAGRCASGRGYAWDVLRVIPPAILTGQAAGAAAIQAVDKKCSVLDIDIPSLQAKLEGENVIIHFDDALVPDDISNVETVDIGHI